MAKFSRCKQGKFRQSDGILARREASHGTAIGRGLARSRRERQGRLPGIGWAVAVQDAQDDQNE